MHDAAHRSSWINARATIDAAAGMGDRSSRQRERHDRHGRNHLWRQRRARSAGCCFDWRRSPAATHRYRRGCTRRIPIAPMQRSSRPSRITHCCAGRHGDTRFALGIGWHAKQGHRRRDGERWRRGHAHRSSQSTPGIVGRVLAGEHIGTRFIAGTRSGSAFKLLGLATQSVRRGTVIVDTGARNAIVERGASLLPIGILRVDGDFQPGDAVEVCLDGAAPFAKGICEYSSASRHGSPKTGSSTRLVGSVHRDQLALHVGSVVG